MNSATSSSVGFCPSFFNTVFTSLLVMCPSLFTSKESNTCLKAAFSSAVTCAYNIIRMSWKGEATILMQSKTLTIIASLWIWQGLRSIGEGCNQYHLSWQNRETGSAASNLYGEHIQHLRYTNYVWSWPRYSYVVGTPNRNQHPADGWGQRRCPSLAVRMRMRKVVCCRLGI